MLEIRGDFDLAQEPIDAEHGAELRLEHLEGDTTLVPEVARDVDGRHAARADLPLDEVATGQRAGELGGRVHDANLWRAAEACQGRLGSEGAVDCSRDDA